MAGTKCKPIERCPEGVMCDARSVSILGSVLQQEQSSLASEWVGELTRLHKQTGRCMPISQMTSECETFLCAFRNAICDSSQPLHATERWLTMDIVEQIAG